jgi:hypothetical protein
MSDLIPQKIDLKKVEEEGRKIYNVNRGMRSMMNVMEHPEFREFYNDYMTDWDSLRVMSMFMKLYDTVEKRSKFPLSPYQKIAVVEKIITNPEMRQEVIKGMLSWTGEDKKRDERGGKT